MKRKLTNAAYTRIVTTILALLIALSLSVPAHAKDIELEPDGFASGATSAVSSTAPATHDGDSVASAQAQVAAAAHGSAAAAQRSAPRSAEGLTLSSFFNWLWSLPFFGG